MKHNFLIILFFITGLTTSILGQNHSSTTTDMKIVYIGDPMCSWCYGVSNELDQVVQYYQKSIGLEIVLGGLRPGGGEEWNEEFKNFLKHHWEDVSARSGMPFSYDLFAKKEFLYDTEPSCRAVVVVKEMANDKAFKFFKMVQKKFYLENEDPKLADFYKSICEELTINFEQFKSKFESDTYINKTKENFQYAQKIGVRSFPTILLSKNGELYTIARGYATVEQMKERIESIIDINPR